MMKYILLLLGLMVMLLLGKKMFMFFYYNLCYFLSMMMIFIHTFKDNVILKISLGLGVNFYSFWLLVLSCWIIGLMIMSLDGDKCSDLLIMLFICLLLILLIFFMAMDLMIFYMMFEISLIPTFMLIIYWGSNPERLAASYYLMVYMLMISFPFLIYMFKIYNCGGSFSFSVIVPKMMMKMVSFWMYLVIFMIFFIKMPIYLFHIWLPKAHVEAPVYGSMILAGVLLKMGGYGLIRMLEMFLKSSLSYGVFIVVISILGSLFTSLSCLVQIDMKSLVAYSSVVHMNVTLSVLITLSKLGIMGGYIMMVAHGLCSSGLFYMVNLFYSRTGSRLLMLNKGITSSMVMMSVWWFLFCVINFSYPFSLNFIGEILMLSVLVNWDLYLIIYLSLICFFSGAYSLYLFSYIYHGGSYLEEKFGAGLLKEYMVLFIHFYPLVLLMLNLLMYM